MKAFLTVLLASVSFGCLAQIHPVCRQIVPSSAGGVDTTPVAGTVTIRTYLHVIWDGAVGYPYHSRYKFAGSTNITTEVVPVGFSASPTTAYGVYPTWSVSAGSLPSGLSLVTDVPTTAICDIRGTPTEDGTFTFTAQAFYGAHPGPSLACSLRVFKPLRIVNLSEFLTYIESIYDTEVSDGILLPCSDQSGYTDFSFGSLTPPGYASPFIAYAGIDYRPSAYETISAWRMTHNQFWWFLEGSSTVWNRADTGAAMPGDYLSPGAPNVTLEEFVP